MTDRGCGAYIGSDPSNVPLHCGTVRAALCAKCRPITATAKRPAEPEDNGSSGGAA